MLTPAVHKNAFDREMEPEGSWGRGKENTSCDFSNMKRRCAVNDGALRRMDVAWT